MPISSGVPTFDNLTRGTSVLDDLNDLTWSGASSWDPGAGNSAPPDPDQITLADVPLSTMTAGADLVALAFADTIISMRVDGTGGAYPGINIFHAGTLAPARDTSGGTLGLNGQNTTPSAFDNANIDWGYYLGSPDSPGGWLVNPDPPNYPGKDSGDATTDILWTPAQVLALADDYWAVQLEGGLISHMGSGTGGGTTNAHRWGFTVLPFTQDITSRLMCVL